MIKIFVLSNFEWPFYTGFTVYAPDEKSRGNFQAEEGLKFHLCVKG